MTKFERVVPAGDRLPVSKLQEGDWVPSWGTLIKLPSGAAVAGLFGPDTDQRSPHSLQWITGDRSIPVNSQVKIFSMDSFAGVTRVAPETKFTVSSNAGFIGLVSVEGYKDEVDIRVDVPGKVTIWVNPDELIEAAEKARTIYQP